MPNPLRGEAALGEHKLVVDFNSFCSLETATDLKLPDLVVMMKTGIGFGFTELRQFVRVFLDKPMSDAEVGDLIWALGIVDVPAPVEQRENGESETVQAWLAADALGKAVDGFLSPPKETRGKPSDGGVGWDWDALQVMWIEAGQPPGTFWSQTQRSFVNTLTGAAKREISLAWKIAALTASASVGKLPKLDELLSPADSADHRTQNAKLLHGLFRLKAQGIPMNVERIERLH